MAPTLSKEKTETDSNTADLGVDSPVTTAQPSNMAMAAEAFRVRSERGTVTGGAADQSIAERGGADAERGGADAHDHDLDEPQTEDDIEEAGGKGPVKSTRFGADPGLAAVAEGKSTLTTGATGVAVIKIQQALVDLGYLDGKKVSGTFDAATTAAVKAFQKAVPMADSGTVDKATFEKLDGRFGDHSVEGGNLKGLKPSSAPTKGTPWPVGSAPAELTAGTRKLSSAETKGFNEAISTGVKKDPISGKLPSFVKKVGGKTYGERVEAVITRTVNAYLTGAKQADKDRKAGNKYDWGDINQVGAESKKATDAVFGSYAVGNALSGGTATSKIQDAWAVKEKDLAADPGLEDGWAEWRVRKIITGSGSVAKIDKEHGAVQSRAEEKAILLALKTKIVAARKPDLVLIHKNWPAFASGGKVNVQIIKNTAGGFKKSTGREYMWELFQTIIHEYIHTLEHPEHVKYRGGLAAHKGSFTLREGVTDYFTKIAFNNTAITAALRKSVEGPFHEPAVTHAVPKLTTYRQSVNAEQGAAIVGLPNLSAGFFLGMVELIGKP